MAAKEGDGFYLILIAEALADLERRLSEMDMQRFLADRDELALTAFRLSIIGENANRLSAELKERHPELPWTAMYSFRNVVSHEYHRISPDRAWDAVESLPAIAGMVDAELDRLNPNRS
jgi:uncharacterized protein with HEPN domain